MGHFQVLTTYLREALRSEEAERRAWTGAVKRSASKLLDWPTANPSTSANWGPLAAEVHYCHTGEWRSLVAWAEGQLARTGGASFGDHEFLGGYWSAVLGGLHVVAHVARRRQQEVRPAVEAVLRKSHVLLGLLSVHTPQGPGPFPARVIAPALRTGAGPGRADLVELERDYMAVAARHDPGSRPAPPFPKRFQQAAVHASSWVSPDGGAIRAFISNPSPGTAAPLIDLLGDVRLRPTNGIASIVVERRGQDALAWLAGWPEWGPTLPPWPAHLRSGERVEIHHPYPDGWGFGRTGTPGKLRSRRDGDRLVVEVTGARRRWLWPRHDFRIEVRFPAGAWRIVIDATGVRKEE